MGQWGGGVRANLELSCFTESAELRLFHLFYFITSFIPCAKFWSPYLAKATAAARAALPIPNSACRIFVCPNEGMVASAWDL